MPGNDFTPLSTKTSLTPPSPSPKIWRGGAKPIFFLLPSPRFCGEGPGVRLAF